MWIVRNRDGEIAGGHGTLQVDGEGMPRLLPVGDGPDVFLAEQEWIPDAEYAEWRRNRPAVKPRDSLAEIDALKAEVEKLKTQATSVR